MKDDIFNQLNSKQKEAIEKLEGPSIILAGAGSGKTRVLVSKVINLIENHHVSPGLHRGKKYAAGVSGLASSSRLHGGWRRAVGVKQVCRVMAPGEKAFISSVTVYNCRQVHHYRGKGDVSWQIRSYMLS